MNLRRRATCLAAVVLIVTSLTSLAGGDAVKKITAAAPCGVTTTATYRHVVWIMLENVGEGVVDSPDAPYLNQLASHCGLATNYFAIAHPSLPNYVALTSGSTQGITDDDEPSAHPLAAASLFSQLGANWRTLAQSMPSACDRVSGGQYAARHNPAVYYTHLAGSCRTHDVALTLPLNVSAKFTMIVPNLCDDMHSCPVTVGDRWLRRIVPLIVSSSPYQARSLVLFITFDENDASSSNRVPTLVIAPSTPAGLRVNQRFSHYALLRTTESLLHVGDLGNAQRAPSMAPAFHL